MNRTIKLLVTFIIFIFIACEDESLEPVVGNTEYVINANSGFFDLLERMTSNTGTAEGITCIDFIYPLTIYTYDADLVFITSQQINSDSEFSELLSELEPSYSISLSLPITSSVTGGNSINISSYEELEQAINECLEDEFLAYCNERLPDCIWEVSSTNPSVNVYEDSFFDVNENGTVEFHHEGEIIPGTWINLIIDGEVHLNINLDMNSIVSVDWNFDWLITLDQDNNFQITNGDNSYILEQNCDEPCTELIFRECETVLGSGIADFALDNYTDCIVSFLELDPTIVSLTFHITQTDAETEVNPIADIFNNTVNPQTIFVRIENTLLGSITYASITLEVTSC